jgi:hypothetical protein
VQDDIIGLGPAAFFAFVTGSIAKTINLENVASLLLPFPFLMADGYAEW